MLGKWTKLISSSRLRRSSQSVAVLDSKAWVFGGELQPREPVDSQFDTIDLADEAVATATFAPADTPSPRVGSAMTSIRDALYLFSGRGGVSMAPIEEKGALWQYAPADTTSWTLIPPADPAAPYPAGRSYHAISSDERDTIFIHGGCPETDRLSDLWSFSLATRRWTELPPAPPPARGGASMTFNGGQLYHIYDSVAFVPDGVVGPPARSVCALLPVRLGQRHFLVTLFGERDPSTLGHAGAGKMLDDVWAFDLDTEVWSRVQKTGTYPPARGWFAADVLARTDRDAVIVHGSLAEDNSRLGDVWRLDLS